MSKFELYFPTKPYIVTQAWGIKNPSYEQFGFSRHNGTDSRLPEDRKLYAPCDLEVTDVGYNSGAGNFIKWVTPHKVTLLGTECWVGGTFMHMEKQSVKVGDSLTAGSYLGLCDSTGFSTGPHLHMSLYRLKSPDLSTSDLMNRLDTDSATNYTFDPEPFFNKYYAVDAQRVQGMLLSIIALLKRILKQ